MKTRAVVLALAILAAGCSKETEKKMNESYDRNFRSSCIGSATKGGIPAATASSLCDCALTEINKKYSATEKLTMSSSDAQPILEQCLKKTVQQ